MSFAQMDGDKLSASAQSALGELVTELKAVIKKEEPVPASNGGAIDPQGESAGVLPARRPIDVAVVEPRRAGGLAGE